MNEEEEWLGKALHDMETARANFQQNIYDASAFFCQQAVEKALKALYIKKFKKLLKTHDLYLLGQKVGLPNNLLEICDKISPFYVETRYPDSYAEFDEETVKKAIKKSSR
jgi:HEPN domain-containing protein